MNEEEKKAIRDLKILRMGIGLLNCIPGIEKDEVDIKAIDCVLNLIEKQQKEIEELNKSDTSKEQSSMNYYNLYKELEDKIKEIITEFIPKSNHEVVLRAKLIKLLGENKK